MHRRTLLASGLAAAVPLPALAQSAPEFAGIDGWINSAAPLTIAGLRGKVVLVDFWTYSCINCRRTVPYLNRWQAEYGGMGLQVIGIHTPEFGFERARRNVETSTRAFGIQFPVGQDNGFQTWRAWNNRAWPAFYLLDRAGRIVLRREGEGHARETEAAIRALLGLPRSSAVHPGDDPDLSRIATPEMYFGSKNDTSQDRAQTPRRGEASYGFTPMPPKPNTYQLDGTWLREEEALVLRSPRGGLRLRFSAAKLHLVATAPGMAKLRLRLDGAELPALEIGEPTLYTLVDGEAYGEHVLECESDTPGLSLFSATFG